MEVRPVVLVVESDPGARDRLASWLEEAGYEVFVCPGPSGPEYVCVGGLGGPCPLVAAADAVVLDLWLEGDTVMEGTPAGELLVYYLASGKAVVALTHEDDPVVPLPDGQIAIVRRPAERGPLLGAVRRLLRPGTEALGG